MRTRVDIKRQDEKQYTRQPSLEWNLSHFGDAVVELRQNPKRGEDVALQ